MKKLLYVLMLSTSMALIISCAGPGGNKKEEASTKWNKEGILVSKNPTDYDLKFGYKVMIYDTVLSKTSYMQIWLPKQSFEKIPEPNDTTRVILHYLTIEGSNNSGDFYLCIGYDIQYTNNKLIIKK